MRTVVVQKAVIVNKDNTILVLTRGETDVRRPGQLDLPGGFCEDGEELIAGVKREIREETGLNPKKVTPIYTITEIREWKDRQGRHKDNVVFIFYLAHVADKKVMISYEHQEFHWLPIQEAISKYEYYLHKNALEHIVANKLLS